MWDRETGSQNPALPDDEFNQAVAIAQDEFGRHRPDVVIGSSRGEWATHLRNGTVMVYTSLNQRTATSRQRKPGGVNSSNHSGKCTNG
jgi:hypothetical protein